MSASDCIMFLRKMKTNYASHLLRLEYVGQSEQTIDWVFSKVKQIEEKVSLAPEVLAKLRVVIYVLFLSVKDWQVHGEISVQTYQLPRPSP